MAFQQPDYDNIFGSKKRKAAKASGQPTKHAAKKAAKRSDKLEKMKIRTERRKNVQDRKQAVGQAQAQAAGQQNTPEPLPPVGVPNTGQGMTTFEPSTPPGTAPTTQQTGGGTSGGGGGGDTIPQDDWNAAEQQQKFQDEQPETPEQVQQGGIKINIVLILVIAAAIYFLPKLLKSKK